MFLDKGQISRLSKVHQGDRYVKKFSTYNHVVVMLFTVLEGYSSIREVIIGLLANAFLMRNGEVKPDEIHS